METPNVETNTDELRRTFAEYVQYNRRDLEDLRRKAIQKLTVALYQEARAVAPTREEIGAKVESLGWRVIKRGTPEQWGTLAARLLPKVNMRGMKKAEREAEKARRKAAVAAQDEREKMAAFVIKKRAARIGFMASAYAVAARALGFNSGRVPALHAQGIASDDGRTTTIAATAGGINDVNDRTGFVRKAIEKVIADMRTYIYDRQKNGRERILR